ncbi:MAG: hypothetical protein K8T25_10925 [Planctomycetia bacterium]|nr:hypothetical protein [Planctomycetia bacterium]
MKFIELSGITLCRIVHPSEIQQHELEAAGVHAESVVRVNEQGDIELRRRHGWDVIGGLLGDYEHRIKTATGFDWV